MPGSLPGLLGALGLLGLLGELRAVHLLARRPVLAALRRPLLLLPLLGLLGRPLASLRRLHLPHLV